jgi:hypothetical protein
LGKEIKGDGYSGGKVNGYDGKDGKGNFDWLTETRKVGGGDGKDFNFIAININCQKIKGVIMEPEFEEKIAATANKALGIVADYFDGKVDKIGKVPDAFKFLPQAIKVFHMQQTRRLQERSQALRLLKFLPDAQARAKYIKITQPEAAALLEHRPKKKVSK